MPPPYKNATCRGSYALRTACGHCERCADDRERMLDKSLKDRPEDTWKAELHEMHHRLAIALGLPPTGPHTTDWEGLIALAESHAKIVNQSVEFRKAAALESIAASLEDIGRHLTTK